LRPRRERAGRELRSRRHGRHRGRFALDGDDVAGPFEAAECWVERTERDGRPTGEYPVEALFQFVAVQFAVGEDPEEGELEQ
jgi:hypothetical protein